MAVLIEDFTDQTFVLPVMLSGLHIQSYWNKPKLACHCLLAIGIHLAVLQNFDLKWYQLELFVDNPCIESQIENIFPVLIFKLSISSWIQTSSKTQNIQVYIKVKLKETKKTLCHFSRSLSAFYAVVFAQFYDPVQYMWLAWFIHLQLLYKEQPFSCFPAIEKNTLSLN